MNNLQEIPDNIVRQLNHFIPINNGKYPKIEVSVRIVKKKGKKSETQISNRQGDDALLNVSRRQISEQSLLGLNPTITQVLPTKYKMPTVNDNFGPVDLPSPQCKRPLCQFDKKNHSSNSCRSGRSPSVRVMDDQHTGNNPQKISITEQSLTTADTTETVFSSAETEFSKEKSSELIFPSAEIIYPADYPKNGTCPTSTSDLSLLCSSSRITVSDDSTSDECRTDELFPQAWIYARKN